MSKDKKANTSDPKVMDKMQEELASKILPMLENVIREREKFWNKNPATSDKTEVPKIISRSSNKCGVIGFGCNLVPGPWGLLAIIPEMTLIVQEQLQMLYDIGRAFGHKQMSKELLLGLLVAGGGAGAGGLVTIIGGKVIVKRASLALIQKIVQAFGGKILQSTLKSLFAKWVPLVGATAMATWARYTTNKLGQKATEIFSKEIVFENQVIQDVNVPAIETGESPTKDVKGTLWDAPTPVPSPTPFVKGTLWDDPIPVAEVSAAPVPCLLVERIRLIIALTWMDRRIDDREREFVKQLLQDPDLSSEAQQELQACLDSGKVRAVDYKAFEGRDDEKIATVMDMIALMKVDEEVHPAERLFVKKVSKEFGLPDADVEEMMAM